MADIARDERGRAAYPPVVDDAVPCACGAVTLVYVSARFVENNVVHASDECQDFGSPAAFDAPPKAVTVTYTADPGGWVDPTPTRTLACSYGDHGLCGGCECECHAAV